MLLNLYIHYAGRKKESQRKFSGGREYSLGGNRKVILVLQSFMGIGVTVHQDIFLPPLT